MKNVPMFQMQTRLRRMIMVPPAHTTPAVVTSRQRKTRTSGKAVRLMANKNPRQPKLTGGVFIGYFVYPLALTKPFPIPT